MHKLVAVVGMPGSGKSEAVKVFEEYGFGKVYFGGIVLEEVERRGLEINEENEKAVREELRRKHGMEAMAKLSLDKIRNGLENGDVVIDGLYSLEEYEFLKKEFPEMVVLCIYSSPKTRYGRLSKRPERPLTKEEAYARDLAQLKNLHTGGPIAMADFTIVNEGPMEELKENVRKFIEALRNEEG